MGGEPGTGAALTGQAARRSLLLSIARCREVGPALRGAGHPCAAVVGVQQAASVAAFQVPEPWSGHLEFAPILFVSSNPALGTTEAYPGGAATDDALVDYFDNRFDGHWIRDGVYARNTDGSYADAQRFWVEVRARAAEVLERLPVPGHDYALTEVVHCKSSREQGVVAARDPCAQRFLAPVIAQARACLLVGLGAHARDVLGARLRLRPGKCVHGPLPIAGRTRMVVLLPHPNFRGGRTFGGNVTPDELARVRAWVRECPP
jgi:hypothetical protein